ncbi:Alkylated DNA repair alkB like 8 [Fusarium sp. NRRL 52700]|nr:Alkylated DNA repair alkB like 8 [Fusarium sp. NRRL 52700]
MLISTSRDANEAESSRLDGRVETAQGSTERHLTLEQVVAELNKFLWKESELTLQENDVEMICSDDEPFDFNTVTKIYPREGHHHGASDIKDAGPSDEQDHEPPKLARLARMRARHHSPPSLSGLPPRYTQFRQEYIINVYFDAFNQATPLFSEYDYEIYQQDCRQHGNTGNEWCAIYVMLALALRNNPKGHYQEDEAEFVRTACTYVDKNLYVLSNEAGLQVVLGIALYFMTTSDLARAGLMHAIAVKLIYRLGFHKMFGESVKPVWIAYIIDRDLSLITGEPYLMQEHDIDPSATDLSEEDGGILFNKDTSLRFEIFKFRARLATIQGKIFDLVYSVRAEKLSFDQRETVADRLEDMLEKWVDSIPEPFRGDSIPGFDHFQLRLVKQLHVTYYHCIFSIRQANLRNLEWVERLLDFREARDPAAWDTPLLPSNWPTLVTAARRCLDTVAKVDSRDMAFRWGCTHATQAAMTILAANNITLSEHNLHDSIDQDQQRLHIAHGEVSEHEQKLIHIFENELEWPTRAGRLSLHYGYTFSYKTFGIDEGTPFKPFPEWLAPLLPTTEGRPPDQVCLQQYAPGTGIPPHVDTHGPFDQLYSLSLGSPLFMQFANKETGEKIEVDLLPRSMMQMSGDSRLHWTHGIKSRKTDTLPDGTVRLRQIRWSLTYRWLREGAECECGNEKLCDTAQRRKGIEREYRWKQYEEDAKAPQS